MAENLLKQMGFRYQSAINGASAIECFKNESFDMVLSDLGLPDIQGMDVCRQLRAHEKETVKRAIPIVGLTAHSVADIGEEGKAAGMNQVLTKPIRREMVEELLATYSLNENSKERSSPSPALSNPDSPEHLLLLDEALAMSYLGGKDEVKELIEIMLNQSIPDTVTSIEQQYESKNWPDFKKAVHKFKSSCMYCATSRLLHHTKNLESLADTGNPESIKPEYESFLCCLDMTRVHLENWLQNCQ